MVLAAGSRQQKGKNRAPAIPPPLQLSVGSQRRFSGSIPPPSPAFPGRSQRRPLAQKTREVVCHRAAVTVAYACVGVVFSESDLTSGRGHKDPPQHMLYLARPGHPGTEQVRYCGVWELSTFWWRHLVPKQGTHIPSCPRVCSRPALPRLAGGRLANLPPAPSHACYQPF